MSSNRLTFTSSNWWLPQTVTLSAADDDDKLSGSRAITHDPSGGGYDGVANATLTATEVENDAGIILSPADRIDVPEGGTATYTVKLSTQPSADVTISISRATDDGSDEDITVTGPTSLTFTPSNWNAARTVTLAAAQDDDINEWVATIKHTASSTDADYNGKTANLIAKEDEDDAGIVLNPAYRIDVPEGGTATYTVNLSTQPSADVTISISRATDDGSDEDITVTGPASLTFSPDNWNAARTVTLAAAQDDDVFEWVATIKHTASSTDANYDGKTANLIAKEDEDDAGIVLNPISRINVPEGGTATYTVNLSKAPTADVTVTISRATDDGSDEDITVKDTDDSQSGDQTGPIVFTTQNWNAARTVTLAAAQDDDVNGWVATIKHAAASTDADYDGKTAKLTAREDEDDAGIAVWRKNGAWPVEENGTGVYYVRLSTEPTSNVTITITAGSGDTDITIKDTDDSTTGDQTGPITFTPQNYSTPREVTLAAKEDDDTLAGGRHINHTATSSDTDYNGKTARLTAWERENDKGINTSPSALTVPEGDSESFGVKLSLAPTADVTVSLTATGDDEITYNPSSLTFTTSNWHTSQDVTVSFASDNDAANKTKTITLNASGGGYNSITKDLTVTGLDASKGFPVGSNPTALWSDGTTMWVTRSSSSQGVRAYTLATGVRDTSKEFNLHADNGDPEGIWANSSTFWIADEEDEYIYAYNRSSGNRDTSKDIDHDRGTPRGIWGNGVNMWVADSASQEALWAYWVNSLSRNALKDYRTLNAAGNGSPRDLWSDGETMWVTDYIDGKVYAYNQLDKSRVPSKDYTLDTANTDPTGIWSDGTTVWVADRSDDILYSYPAHAKSKLVGSNLGATVVTLTVSGHTGQWWYKSTTSGQDTCTSAGSTASTNVTGLTKNTQYTFTAYSDSSCGTVHRGGAALHHDHPGIVCVLEGRLREAVSNWLARRNRQRR